MNIQHKHTTKSTRILNFTPMSLSKKIIYGILPPQVMKVRDRVEISKTIKTLPYFYVPI